MAVVTKNVEVAGRRLSIETGRVAEQANGAVILRQGDSVVLSTAVMSKDPRVGVDFFPFRSFFWVRGISFLSRIFRGLLRRKTLCSERRFDADGSLYAAAFVPELVSASLSARVREVPPGDAWMS